VSAALPVSGRSSYLRLILTLSMLLAILCSLLYMFLLVIQLALVSPSPIFHMHCGTFVIVFLCTLDYMIARYLYHSTFKQVYQQRIFSVLTPCCDTLIPSLYYIPLMSPMVSCESYSGLLTLLPSTSPCQVLFRLGANSPV